MKEVTIKELSSCLRYAPLMLHINPVGLIRLGTDNIERYFNLNIILNNIQKNGGNIAVPCYSYSYTKDEIYDICSTKSTLNEISEFLREKNISKRTADANFSYLMFGDGFSSKHLSVSDYSTFGEGSLIEEIYNKDGYLGAIGGALEYLTEIHYLERKLNTSYCFDKIFKEPSINVNGKVVEIQ